VVRGRSPQPPTPSHSIQPFCSSDYAPHRLTLSACQLSAWDATSRGETPKQMEQTPEWDASSEYGGAGVGGGGGLSFHCIIHLSSDSTCRRTPELIGRAHNETSLQSSRMKATLIALRFNELLDAVRRGQIAILWIDCHLPATQLYLLWPFPAISSIPCPAPYIRIFLPIDCDCSRCPDACMYSLCHHPPDRIRNPQGKRRTYHPTWESDIVRLIRLGIIYMLTLFNGHV
jgi:hypothetical protein